MGIQDLQELRAIWESWDSEEILENQVKKDLQVKSEPLQEISD